jgi:hypothetical protein
MGKKLMSCLVAFAFVMSIASSAVFAAPSQTAEPQSTSSSAQQLVKDPSNDKDKALESNIVSKITTVYNWMAGNLVSVGGADRSITLMKNGAAFISLGYDPTDGSYAVTGINLTGADWSHIQGMEGATDTEKLKNYLKGFGITDGMLQTQEEIVDKDGNPASVTSDEKWWKEDGNYVTGKTSGKKYSSLAEYNERDSVDVAWLQTAVDSLKSGINHSISVNIADSGGATLTVVKNGSAVASYAAGTYDGKVFKTAQYNYTGTGFLSSVTNYKLEGAYSDNALKYHEALQKYIANNPTVENPGEKFTWDVAKNYGFGSEENFIDCNNAYADALSGTIKYEVKTTTTYYNGAGKVAFAADDKGNTITQYYYSKNGSMLKHVDLKNEITYLYQGNRVSQILNSKGFLLTQYNFHTNGTIDNVVNYNDGNATTMTVFSHNRELATTDFTGGTFTANQIRSAYFDMTTPGKTAVEIRAIAEKHQLTGFQMYSSHLNNTALMNFALNPNGKTDTETINQMNSALKVMRLNQNYSSPVGSVSLVDGTNEKFEYYYTVDGEKITGATEEETDNKMKQRMYEKIRDTNKQFSQLKDKDGNRVTDDKGNFLEGKSSKDIDLTASTSTGQSAHMITKTTKKTTEQVLTVSVTVNSRGAMAYVTSDQVVKSTNADNPETTTTKIGGFSDPAVVGIVDDFVIVVEDENGEKKTVSIAKENIAKYLADNPGAKVYAKVGDGSLNSGINMMDGNGFQPLKLEDGEEIFVEVTADMARELSIGGEAMFMGDVSIDPIIGEYTMRTNDNYYVTANGRNYKGFVAGADVAAAKKEIQSESEKIEAGGVSKYDWINVNTNINRGLFGLGSGSYLNDWREGWAILRSNAE